VPEISPGAGGDGGPPARHPAGTRRRRPQKRTSEWRVPPLVDGIQVNHCRNPECANFGVAAQVTPVKVGRPEGTKGPRKHPTAEEASCRTVGCPNPRQADRRSARAVLEMGRVQVRHEALPMQALPGRVLSG
jgi:hypothetical protein